MYQIMCDNYILHDARVPELKVIQAKCSLALNKTGSLTFYIAPNHPYYNKVKKHQSEITLYQDNTIIFRGRVLNDEIDFDNIKSIECEGELAYFLDSIQRGKVYHLDGGSDNVIETYLKSLVEIHNSQVDDRKKFTVGNVTVTDSNNYLYKISNYEDTLSTINDKLIKSYGGYIRVRHENNVRYIDYLESVTNTSNQTIEFGKNIIDMTKHINGEDVYTALIPLGANIKANVNDDTTTSTTYDNRVNISDLPDETDGTIVKADDYIYDTEAVAKWGWIWKVEKWNDVTVASNLLNKAKQQLRSSIDAMLTIEMTAIDLHLLNVDVDRISIGDNIKCISKPHDLDIELIVNSITIDLDNPANTTIKLTTPDGKPIPDKSMSSDNKDNKKDIIDVKDLLSKDYTTREDFDKLKDRTNNQISSNNDALKNWTNNQISSNNDALKNWVSDNFYPATGGEVNLSDYAKTADVDTKINDLKDWTNTNYQSKTDLSEYAKIADVNTAFNELATAIEGV